MSPGEPGTGVPPSLGTLAAVFLRLSLLGFGGPSAHLALMLDEVVERRRWITREHFLHLVAVTNLLPGPNSSEVAIHVGYTQRGSRGALVTGTAFLAPTLAIVLVLSALYFRYATLPAVEPLFWALKPVIVAVVLAAGWRLGRATVSDATLLALAALGVASALAPGSWEVPAMAAAGIVGWLRHRAARGERALPVIALPLLAALAAPGTLAQLLGLMLAVGSVLFGGGYMLVALLQPYAVERFGWLTAAQFLDGVALTQAVPGPISTLAAFVGYAAAGAPGALLATAGLYLPAFAAVLAVAPRLERWRRLAVVRAVLAGVNATVAGAIVGVGLRLGWTAVDGPAAGALLLVALGVSLGTRLSASWLVLGGLLAGLARLLLL